MRIRSRCRCRSFRRRDIGDNKITVTIDPGNLIPEVTYANNTVTMDAYIYQNGATPVYPYNYAIINTPTATAGGFDQQSADPKRAIYDADRYDPELQFAVAGDKDINRRSVGSWSLIRGSRSWTAWSITGG